MAIQQLLKSLSCSHVTRSGGLSAKAQIELWFDTYLCGLCGYMQGLQGAMAELFPYSGHTLEQNSKNKQIEL